MRNILFIFLIITIPFVSFAQNSLKEPSPVVHIIPEPVSVQTGEGYFQLNKDIDILIQNNRVKDIADGLVRQLANSTGFHLSTVRKRSSHNTGSILLKLNKDPDTELDSAGYELEVTSKQVVIAANQPQGLFYGLQTLWQLLPPEIASDTLMSQTAWKIPCVKIRDYPRFGWRGLMLDVSRHFFTVEEVKEYIDEMVKYKFNVFHWHLTDNSGWRIEIKGLPRLTEVGAWRVMRTGRWGTFKEPKQGEIATYGGFYTQEEIREVVSYARKRFVTILPEIDVPGHSLALIAAYPNLSSTKKQYTLWPQYPPGRINNVLDVASDSVWLILDKILTQVALLFPGAYIHVGGDEADKSFWMKSPQALALMKKEGIEDADGLQSYFMKKLERMVASKGKKMMGWDEILEGGIAPEAAVMSWRGMEGGINAAKMGHHVVMTPSTHAYLDYYQGDPLVEPFARDQLLLKTAYDFEPLPEGVNPGFILGGQGNVWTEDVPTFRHVQYMTWPRAMALSEVFWSPKKEKDWSDFVKRMDWRLQYLDFAKVKYARSQYNAIITAEKKTDTTSIKVKLDTQIPGLDVFYTFDNTNPDEFSPKYNGKPLDIPEGAYEVRVITYRDGKPIGQQINCPILELKNR